MTFNPGFPKLFYTIYKITDTTNNKTYIGKHQTKNLQDGYMGSGKLIRRAIKAHGKENFIKEILHTFLTEEEMNQAEKELVVIGENSYNLCEGGKGGFGYINQFGNPKRGFTKEETIRGINTRKNRLNQDEVFRQHMLDIWKTQGQKNLRPNDGHTFLGKTHSIQTKKCIGQKNSIHQDSSKNSQYGTCWITNGTENKKIKKDDLDNWISLGYYKGRVGLSMSDEAKLKISKAMKGKIPWNKFISV